MERVVDGREKREGKGQFIVERGEGVGARLACQERQLPLVGPVTFQHSGTQAGNLALRMVQNIPSRCAEKLNPATTWPRLHLA